MNTIDKILLTIALFFLLFTITMIVIFCIFQSVPDTLIECVIQAITSEGVITFAIWWIKKKAKGDKNEKKVDK